MAFPKRPHFQEVSDGAATVDDIMFIKKGRTELNERYACDLYVGNLCCNDIYCKINIDKDKLDTTVAQLVELPHFMFIHKCIFISS